MARILQFVRTVRERRCLKRHICRETDSVTAMIRDLDPAHAAVIARLLRTQIRLDLVRRRALVDAETCAAAAVDVVFLRPIAVEANAVIIRMQRKDHGKVGHLGHPRRLILHRDANFPARLRRIGDHARSSRLRGKRISKAYGDALGAPFIASAEETVHRLEIFTVHAVLDARAAAVEARELPLRRGRHASAAVVIVDRRTPEARLRHFLDQLPSAMAIGDEIALRA